MARYAGSCSPHVNMKVIGKWEVRSESRACLIGRRKGVKRKCSTWWRVAGAEWLYTHSGKTCYLGRENNLCRESKRMQPAPVISVTMTQ